MGLKGTDLSVKYSLASGGSLTAIQNLDIDIAAGEFISIIGPSGCGKSTLLHCLGGLITPSGGEITVRDSRITAPNPRLAAFVFQDYTLLPWKNVLDNVALGLRFAGVQKADRRRKAEEMLALVGLSEMASSYPRELSGGMQQRVAVARAMAMDPEILLMDEPFGALDEQTRRHLGFEMSRMLTEAKRTVVMVTHSLDEAILWADRIIVLSARPGRIIREISVPEARPRRLEFVATPRFAEVRSELFRLLENTSGSASSSNGAAAAVQ